MTKSNQGKTFAESNDPCSLTFCQIVALMLPHHGVVAGRLDEWPVARNAADG